MDTAAMRADPGSEFELFAAASLPRLRRLAHAWCRDSHRADDLVQGALERAFAAWPRVCRADDPFAYTRTIMIRLLISEQRRAWFRRESSQAVLPDGPSGQHDLDARLDMVQLIRKLPHRQRLVILLRFAEDLSVTEVAELLGCSPGTVKSQTHAALITLRRHCPATPSAEGSP